MYNKMMITVSGFLAGLLSILLIAISLFTTQSTNAQGDQTPTPSEYGNLLDTEVRGISSENIEGYRTGKGLGMALPAELNGYPGPRHVLDLSKELNLTDDQQEAIQTLYDDMLPEAIRLGEAILEQEAELESTFRDQTITETSLQAQLDALGALYAELRFIHLRTHLSTIDILNQHQVYLYNQLRGYETDANEDNHSEHDGHQSKSQLPIKLS